MAIAALSRIAIRQRNIWGSWVNGPRKDRFKSNVKDKGAGGTPALQSQLLRFAQKFISAHLVIVAGYWGAAAAYQEIEVGALMGLLDVVSVELYVPAGWVWRRRPLGAAGG